MTTKQLLYLRYEHRRKKRQPYNNPALERARLLEDYARRKYAFKVERKKKIMQLIKHTKAWYRLFTIMAKMNQLIIEQDKYIRHAINK